MKWNEEKGKWVYNNEDVQSASEVLDSIGGDYEGIRDLDIGDIVSITDVCNFESSICEYNGNLEYSYDLYAEDRMDEDWALNYVFKPISPTLYYLIKERRHLEYYLDDILVEIIKIELI